LNSLSNEANISEDPSRKSTLNAPFATMPNGSVANLKNKHLKHSGT
jgi:hypothetical protein